jgi:hypothetical protein
MLFFLETTIQRNEVLQQSSRNSRFVVPVAIRFCGSLTCAFVQLTMPMGFCYWKSFILPYFETRVTVCTATNH